MALPIVIIAAQIRIKCSQRAGLIIVIVVTQITRVHIAVHMTHVIDIVVVIDVRLLFIDTIVIITLIVARTSKRALLHA